jgi:hypothetical protein
MDREWSMKLSSVLPVVLFDFDLTGGARANDQQLPQQTCMNAGINPLSVRFGLSPGHRSDLQARHKRETRSLVRRTGETIAYVFGSGASCQGLAEKDCGQPN